jgi:hypothetical protein
MIEARRRQLQGKGRRRFLANVLGDILEVKSVIVPSSRRPRRAGRRYGTSAV